MVCSEKIQSMLNFSIGKSSKHVLDKVNQKVLSVSEVNQWKYSHSVIEQFKNIRNKSSASFFVFDIESFYLPLNIAKVTRRCHQFC